MAREHEGTDELFCCQLAHPSLTARRQREKTIGLLTQWPKDEEVPTKFWLAYLPEGTSLISLVCLAEIRWWIEQGYQQLKNELGLDHYEGRTWQGWHHHVTLTSLPSVS
jgi:SRSO17 transposase